MQRRRGIKTLVLIGGWLGSCFAPSSFAAGAHEYQPPAVPKYYEDAPEAKTEFNRMKKSYTYIEGQGSIGQSRPTNSSSPRTSYGLDLKLGYVKSLGAWRFLDSSISLMSHSVGFTHTEMAIPVGVMMQFGYGYTIHPSVSAVIKAGVAALMGEFKETFAGVTRRNEDTLLGNAVQLGYGFLVPFREQMMIDTGISWTHLNFYVGDVKTSLGTVEALDRSINLNVYEFQLGLRYIMQ